MAHGKQWHRMADSHGIVDLPFKPCQETFLSAPGASQIVRALAPGGQAGPRTKRAHVDVLVDVPNLGSSDYVYLTTDALLCDMEKLGPVVEKDPVDGVRGVVALWQYCGQEWRLEVFYTGAGRLGVAHLFPIDPPHIANGGALSAAAPRHTAAPAVYNPRSADPSMSRSPSPSHVSERDAAVAAVVAAAAAHDGSAAAAGGAMLSTSRDKLGEAMRAAQLAIQYLTIARSEAAAAQQEGAGGGGGAAAATTALALTDGERAELARLRTENEVLRAEKAALQLQKMMAVSASPVQQGGGAATSSRSVSPAPPAAHGGGLLSAAARRALSEEEAHHFVALQREAECLEEIRQATAAAANGNGVAVHVSATAADATATAEVELLRRTLETTRRELESARQASTEVERTLRQELHIARRDLSASVQRQSQEREASQITDLRVELQAARAEIARMNQRVVSLSSPVRTGHEQPQPNPPPSLGGRGVSGSPLSHQSSAASHHGSTAPRRTPPQKRPTTPSPVLMPPPPPPPQNLPPPSAPASARSSPTPQDAAPPAVTEPAVQLVAQAPPPVAPTMPPPPPPVPAPAPMAPAPTIPAPLPASRGPSPVLTPPVRPSSSAAAAAASVVVVAPGIPAPAPPSRDMSPAAHGGMSSPAPISAAQLPPMAPPARPPAPPAYVAIAPPPPPPPPPGAVVGFPLMIPTDESSGFGRPPSRSPSYGETDGLGGTPELAAAGREPSV